MGKFLVPREGLLRASLPGEGRLLLWPEARRGLEVGLQKAAVCTVTCCLFRCSVTEGGGQARSSHHERSKAGSVF